MYIEDRIAFAETVKRAADLADALRFIDEWLKGTPTGRPINADDLLAARNAIRCKPTLVDALGPISK